MDRNTIRARADRYSAIFSRLGVEPVACDQNLTVPNVKQISSHMMWMCKQIPRLMVENKESQACEWLRFVEGVLWATGVLSFAEMTNDGITPSILRYS